MYGMDEFFESVKELNEEELFYKEYYRIKSPENLVNISKCWIGK